jgi:hypothetical protein
MPCADRTECVRWNPESDVRRTHSAPCAPGSASACQSSPVDRAAPNPSRESELVDELARGKAMDKILHTP